MNISRALEVYQSVREDLDKIIIPNKKVGTPIAPNFFLEAKGTRGTIDVANYLLDEPIYDGNAYAFISTLLDGYLRLHAHHMTAPAMSGQGPAYHTTLLKAYALSDDEAYSEGRGAFRNLRMRAKEDRDRFIEIANTRACHTSSEGDVAAIAIEEQDDGGSSPLEFYDSRMFAEQKDEGETQETRDNARLIIFHRGLTTLCSELCV
ncbi:hypothetical protein GGI42DRAFT_359025 [Trichoderma sp. SZMC 28013]